MIYAIINQKGGTGKTTTAAALLSWFHEKGKKVLGVDMDAQCNLTLAAGAGGSQKTALGVLTGEITAEEAIQSANYCDIIAGSPALSAAEQIFSATGREYRLKEALSQLRGYEHIIIDAPPALGVLSVNALAAADKAIIPCNSDVFSIQGLKQLEDTIEVVRKYCNPTLGIESLLLTKYSTRQTINRDLFDVFAREAAALGTKLFTIRESVAIRQAQAMQQSIFRAAICSGAAIDYNTFFESMEV